MLEILREHELAPRFRRLAKGSDEVLIAVPFWGKGAIKTLGLQPGRKSRVLCNLKSGACNPYVIEAIRRLKKPVEVRSHPRLHAKIYATKKFAIIGSSNASTNGLTLEGNALKGWVEANVLSDDGNLLEKVKQLFEELWSSKETIAIKSATLTDAKDLWDRRPKQRLAIQSKTLFAACRENPSEFKRVYVFPYKQGLSKDQNKKLREIRKESVKPSGVQTSDFSRAWGYDFGEVVRKDTWIVNLNCIGPKKPRVHGCAQVTGLRLKSLDLTLAIPGVFQTADGDRFPISSEEKADLAENAIRFLKRDKMLPLAEAIRIIDKQKRN